MKPQRGSIAGLLYHGTLSLAALLPRHDVVEAAGLLYLNRMAVSNKVRILRFWHRNICDRARILFNDESMAEMLESTTGTAVPFRAGGEVHKASPPSSAHRDVMTLALIPSVISWRERYARNRHLLSTNADTYLDFRTGRPQDIGFRF